MPNCPGSGGKGKAGRRAGRVGVAGAPSREAPVAVRPETGFPDGRWQVFGLANRSAGRPLAYCPPLPGRAWPSASWRRSFSLTAAGQSRSFTGFPFSARPREGDGHQRRHGIGREGSARQELKTRGKLLNFTDYPVLAVGWDGGRDVAGGEKTDRQPGGFPEILRLTIEAVSVCCCQRSTVESTKEQQGLPPFRGRTPQEGVWLGIECFSWTTSGSR
jgi:hypothetical protein